MMTFNGTDFWVGLLTDLGSVAKRKNLREASALLSRSKYIFREKAHEKVYSLPGNVFRKRLREASALFPVLLQKRVKCTCFAKEVHLLREDGFFLQQTPGVSYIAQLKKGKFSKGDSDADFLCFSVF